MKCWQPTDFLPPSEDPYFMDQVRRWRGTRSCATAAATSGAARFCRAPRGHACMHARFFAASWARTPLARPGPAAEACRGAAACVWQRRQRQRRRPRSARRRARRRRGPCPQCADAQVLELRKRTASLPDEYIVSFVGERPRPRAWMQQGGPPPAASQGSGAASRPAGTRQHPLPPD